MEILQILLNEKTNRAAIYRLVTITEFQGRKRHIRGGKRKIKHKNCGRGETRTKLYRETEEKKTKKKVL